MIYIYGEPVEILVSGTWRTAVWIRENCQFKDTVEVDGAYINVQKEHIRKKI